MRKNPWKTLNSIEVYKNEWITVRENKVIRPDGKEGIYSVVELPVSACIIAINDKDEIALVEQLRYTNNKFSLEIPSGASNEKDSNLLETAKRELKEETGIIAKDWLSLGEIYESVSFSNIIVHLFVAKDLEVTKDNQDPTEDIEVKWLKICDVVEMIIENKIIDAMSIATILKFDKLMSQGKI